MKILILTSNYPRKNATNNGTFIHQQVKALQSLGAECHVLLLRNWFPAFGLHSLHSYWQQGHALHRSFFDEYEGVKIHSVPMFVRMPTRFFKETFYDRAARAVVKYVRSNTDLQQADWLYAHFLTDNGYIAVKVKDALQIKIATIARGDDIHAWPESDKKLVDNLRAVFSKTDLLMANSGNLGTDAHKWMLPGKIRPVITIYNGIDHVKFHPVGTLEDKIQLKQKFGLDADIKHLICIAAPEVEKGWGELLQAIKKLGNKLDGWKLLAVASKSDHPKAFKIMEVANSLGIADRIVFVGSVPFSDMPDMLRASDLFVLPSYNEGMANALLEAMATGLSCIATEVGGHNEVIEHRSSGLLIPARDTDALAEALETLLYDDELRLQMGIEARKKMIAFGDYKENGTKLLKLFKDGQ